jgi:hypothetical protein
MGLDLTVYPLKHYRSASGTPFLCDSLRLDRDGALFAAIERAPSFPVPQVEVYEDDGLRVRGTNPYGDPVRYVLAGELARVIADAAGLSPWNVAVVAFLRALPADLPVYLWWH